jgi:hypothetical protein
MLDRLMPDWFRSGILDGPTLAPGEIEARFEARLADELSGRIGKRVVVDGDAGVDDLCAAVTSAQRAYRASRQVPVDAQRESHLSVSGRAARDPRVLQ